MIHLPQICLNFLDFFHRLGGKEILWEKGILEIVKGFLNKPGCGSTDTGCPNICSLTFHFIQNNFKNIFSQDLIG
jgi:hypothetical protein